MRLIILLFTCTINTDTRCIHKREEQLINKVIQRLHLVIYLVQWCPTTVSRNTSVPPAGSKRSAAIFEILKLKLYHWLTRYFWSKVFRETFLIWFKCSARHSFLLKCSAAQKRLGTTDLVIRFSIVEDIIGSYSINMKNKPVKSYP